MWPWLYTSCAHSWLFHALTMRTTSCNWHQSWFIHFQNIAFANLVTDDRTDAPRNKRGALYLHLHRLWRLEEDIKSRLWPKTTIAKVICSCPCVMNQLQPMSIVLTFYIWMRQFYYFAKADCCRCTVSHVAESLIKKAEEKLTGWPVQLDYNAYCMVSRKLVNNETTK